MEYKERMLKGPALTLLRARPKGKNYFALTVTCGSSLSCLISRRILEQQFAMLIPGKEAHIGYQNHGDSWSVPGDWNEVKGEIRDRNADVPGRHD
jgi:hypothetical protein